VREILKRVCDESAGDRVFPKASKNTLEDQVRRTREQMKMPKLVLHHFGTHSERGWVLPGRKRPRSVS
jgi:hypothetical protein